MEVPIADMYEYLAESEPSCLLRLPRGGRHDGQYGGLAVSDATHGVEIG